MRADAHCGAFEHKKATVFINIILKLILTAIYRIHTYKYIYKYIVHSRVLIQSLINSPGGESYKEYLAHFKLSFYFLLSLLSALFKLISNSICLMDIHYLPVI